MKNVINKKNPKKWNADDRRIFFKRLIEITKLTFDEQLELSHNWVESLHEQYQLTLLGKTFDLNYLFLKKY